VPQATQQTQQQLIVTRPHGQAESLLEQLKQSVKQTLTIQHLPLLEVKPLAFQLPNLGEVDGAIFVSSNAVSAFFAQTSLTGVPYFAVGNNTAAHIKALTGQSAEFPDQMNSEGLIALPALQQISGQTWLVVKGEGGRDKIQKTLNARGANVVELDVYQRKLPDYSTQQAIYRAQLSDPIWLVTSGDALNHLFRVLGLQEHRQHNTRVIVSSDRLANFARSKGFTIVAQSAGASEKQLVQCVKDRFQ